MQSCRCFCNSDSLGKTVDVQWPSNHITICGSVPCERNSLCLLSDMIAGFRSKTSVNQATFKCLVFCGEERYYIHQVFQLAFVNHRDIARRG